MIIIKDIRGLQFMSFEDSLTEFLPTAKIIRVVYSLNWLILKQKRLPDNIEILWMRVDHPNMLDILQKCIDNSSCPGSPDELIFIDLSTNEGTKILEQYNED